jgi:purine-binding chemotaxis protein CheW
MTARQYATFHVAGHLFGLDVANVQEVLAFDQYTPVPLAPPAIDLRQQLGLPPRTTTGPHMNVIVRTNDEPVSLLVDHIGEVITLTPDTFEPPPDTLHGPARHLITGTAKLHNQLMLALDTNRAVDTTTTPEDT